VFVANPNKPPAITEILANNRDKLLKYLEDFHTDKGGWVGGWVGRQGSEAGLQVATLVQVMSRSCHASSRSDTRLALGWSSGVSELYTLLPMCVRTCADEDEQFKEEKAVIIKEISMLSVGAGGGSAGAGMSLQQHAPAAPALPDGS
jgi:hypothetical protein